MNQSAEQAQVCSCGNRFDGDNLCMPSACQWEGIERPREAEANAPDMGDFEFTLNWRELRQIKAEAWDEGAAKASSHGGAYLRSLLIENPYRVFPPETCGCEHPYIGTQMAGEPVRCERCRGLVNPPEGGP